MTKSNGLSTKTVCIEGLERSFVLDNNSSNVIAHVFAVEGPAYRIIKQVPKAFQKVCNRHPRMRTIQLKSDALKVMVLPMFSLDDAKKCIKFIDCAGTDRNWKTLVEEEGNKNKSRFGSTPFQLTILKLSDTNLKMILFSDHYMSDGFSGHIVFNDLLSQITDPRDWKELPLRPSVYSTLLSNDFGLIELMDNILLSIIKSPLINPLFVHDSIHRLRPSLPILPEINEKVTIPFLNKPNKTYALFESGTETNLKAALERCKTEKVTLHGPIVVAIAIAYKLTKDRLNEEHEIQTTDLIRLSLDIDYNMRSRIKNKFTENNVGCFIGISTLESFLTKGILMDELFWDVARQSKNETDEYDPWSFKSRLALRYSHNVLQPMNFGHTLPVYKSTLGDFNLSNLGRYLFPTKHDFIGSADEIKITECHLYNSSPTISNSVTIFLTSVKSISYSVAHRIDHGVAREFFSLFVKIVEGIGQIDKDATVRDVLMRMK